MLITIDGFSGSLKSTFAKRLEKECPEVRIIEADDFFYKAGSKIHPLSGNFDASRFIKEVIPRLKKGDGFFIKAFDCKTQKYYKKFIKKGKITILEGSYSSTPLLDRFTDKKIFILSPKSLREKRVKRRVGEEIFQVFLDRWFKDEINYQKKFNTMDKSFKIRDYYELKEIICGKR